MSDFRKAQVVIDAVYKDGTTLKRNHSVPARVTTCIIPGAPDKYRELSLRMVVDSRDSEELLEGLCRGRVSLSIEQIPPAVNRDSNS